MPDHKIRFAVSAPDGGRSDVWTCWTNVGKGKRDVYLTSKPLGYAAKLSLHESGQWHVAFLAEKRDELFDPGTAPPPDRFMGKWERADALKNPIVRAAVVYFPWSCPFAGEPVHKPVAWLPIAPEKQMTEVWVLLIDGQLQPNDWSAKDSMGTKLVGHMPMEHGGTVAIVYGEVPMFEGGEPRQGVPRYFKGSSEADLAQVNRLVAWGAADDGAIMFLECPLTVQRK
jgi:hypothetical protein